jgi:arginine decarboxylase
MYGMTETTGAVTWAATRIKPGTVGPALPGCEIRVADDGEVLCRGPVVFAGYLKEPDRTAEVMDEDGWFHTGDIGQFDQDGYLTILDRKKELIITARGDNVSPANLEAAVKSVPLVGQACVVGDGRPYVAGLVTLDPEATTTWARRHGYSMASLAQLARHPEVVAEVERGLQEAMRPFNQAEAVKKVRILETPWVPDSDELTPTSQLKRRAINEKYADEIEALYSTAANQVNPLAYNSLWHLRADGWSSLEETTEQLAASIVQGRATEKLLRAVGDTLELLEPMEHFFAFPGRLLCQQVVRLHTAAKYDRLATAVASINRALTSDAYRSGAAGTIPDAEDDMAAERIKASPVEPATPTRPYFEVLVVDDVSSEQEQALHEELRRLRRPDDQFVYELVVVPTLEDALIAAMVNFNLQACIIRPRFHHRSRHELASLAPFVLEQSIEDLTGRSADERVEQLGRMLKHIRPELDLYLMSQSAVEDVAARLSRDFRRIFHHQEGFLELHLSLLNGVGHRYRTPFFAALKEYSHRPTGVFHALPISQGKSIVSSHWIKDMIGFYGLDLFLAETSATSGGLDSLLEPTGALRDAQQLAGETFGSHKTFFVTNGTSTGNKIVVQALVRPGDIVLVDRNCHQSHHYGLVMSGAQVAYLDAYRLNSYTMYGAVPLREIKRQLLAYRAAGKLDQVKMLLLTNCTFDGIVYNVERVMGECLAIKPDLVFLWDEAWFAFARFHPVFRHRTAMAAAQTLLDRFRDPDYRRQYTETAEVFYRERPDDDAMLDMRLLPDPARARVRVYATQSTHKTLTALRQGSMIHIFDQDFSQKVEETFHEAYMAHTSTSPNYQILASLDLGRRQASLEGFELVQKQIENAMRLRDAVEHHPLLRNYVRCLTTPELIPSEHRVSGIDRPILSGLPQMMRAWEQDEFVLDPSRITLHIGSLGVDGDTFKHGYLMDRFGVQVNKTSRNTVLFMTNIGTTRSSVAYLIEVLVTVARQLEDQLSDMSPRERAAYERRVLRLTNVEAPLPDFSAFHQSFRPGGAAGTPEGDIRSAFFLAYDDSLCEYLLPEEIEEQVDSDNPPVSATFVTPYPPGFPVLVPGQIISRQILSYMRSLDTREIHGLRPDVGYRVFTDKALELAAFPAY